MEENSLILIKIKTEYSGLMTGITEAWLEGTYFCCGWLWGHWGDKMRLWGGKNKQKNAENGWFLSVFF